MVGIVADVPIYVETDLKKQKKIIEAAADLWPFLPVYLG